MGDEFDFTRPERREAKSFEPPPWEAEAFERLRRQREAEKDDAGTPCIVEQATESDNETRENDGENAATAASPKDEAPVAGVDEGRMTLMLALLAAEEPDARSGMHSLATAVSVAMVVVGLVLVVWGMVALAGSGTSGRIGVVGGWLFFFFGVASVGFAVWLIVRTLRQRGVL